MRGKGMAIVSKERILLILVSPHGFTENFVPSGHEAAFVFADRVLAFDHAEGTLHLVCLCEREGATRSAAAEWMQVPRRRARCCPSA